MSNDSPLVSYDVISDGDFSDLTLVTEDDKSIHCHQIIMSSVSSFLRNMIKNNRFTSKDIVIFLPGINYKDLANITDFIYKQSCHVEQERLASFFKAAKCLEIRGLLETDLEIPITGLLGNIASSTGSENKPLDKLISIPDEIKIENPMCNSEDQFKATDFDINKLHSVSYLAEEYHDKESSQDNHSQPEYVEQPIYKKKAKKLLNLIISNLERVERRYKCSHCDYSSQRQSIVKNHIEVKHEGKTFQCEKCDYNAKQSKTLELHIDSKHEGISFSCDQCERKFISKYNLYAHKENVHEKKKHQCMDCLKFLGSRTALQTHTKIKHLKQKFSCDECGILVCTKFQLKRHIDYKHRGITFDCQQCDYKCNSNSKLREHARNKH